MTNSMSAGIARTPDKPRTDDRYPSRFDTRAHVSNRHDPVVYGSADDGSEQGAAERITWQFDPSTFDVRTGSREGDAREGDAPEA